MNCGIFLSNMIYLKITIRWFKSFVTVCNFHSDFHRWRFRALFSQYFESILWIKWTVMNFITKNLKKNLRKPAKTSVLINGLLINSAFQRSIKWKMKVETSQNLSYGSNFYTFKHVFSFKWIASIESLKQIDKTKIFQCLW